MFHSLIPERFDVISAFLPRILILLLPNILVLFLPNMLGLRIVYREINSSQGFLSLMGKAYLYQNLCMRVREREMVSPSDLTKFLVDYLEKLMWSTDARCEIVTQLLDTLIETFGLSISIEEYSAANYS